MDDEVTSPLHALHFTGPPDCDKDELGFYAPWSVISRSEEERERKERSAAVLQEAKREYAAFWKEYLPVLVRRRRRWDEANPRANPHILQRFVHKGIPSALRKEIWLRGIMPRSSPPSSLYKPDETVVHAIRIDLPRTFPDNENLSSEKARNRLGRILYALAQQIPAIGYCQGLNFIGAMCLLVIEDEEKARDLLLQLILPRASYYDNRMSGLTTDMKVMQELVRRELPSVWAALHRVQLGLDILIGKWFLCLFVDSIPMESVLRVWDCLIYDGDVWIFKVAMRLLRGHSKKISKASTMEGVMEAVHDIGCTKNAMQCHTLIKESAKESIDGKEIDQLRRSYDSHN